MKCLEQSNPGSSEPVFIGIPIFLRSAHPSSPKPMEAIKEGSQRSRNAIAFLELGNDAPWLITTVRCSALTLRCSAHLSCLFGTTSSFVRYYLPVVGYFPPLFGTSPVCSVLLPRLFGTTMLFVWYFLPLFGTAFVLYVVSVFVSFHAPLFGTVLVCSGVQSTKNGVLGWCTPSWTFLT